MSETEREHLDVHGHAHGESPPLHALAARFLWPTVALCAAITVVAVVLLWPGGGDEFDDPLLLDADPIAADVTSVSLLPCSYSPLDDCRVIEFLLVDHPVPDQFGTIEEGPDTNIGGGLDVGDAIWVLDFESVDGTPTYSFYDHRRGGSMLWLVVLFVAAVVALGRWRGVGALAGLAFSLGAITVFTLPAILDGSNALVVALATAALIAFAALFLAHGFGPATAVALLSTFASLVITAVLAAAFVGASHLTGLTDDSSLMLGGLAGEIDARGILLAGIVIGSLGVLDDVTVTQVSAVWQLKRLRPEAAIHELVGPALRIGRDHISSTVNTLFLAYAGAALPLLLLFTEAGQGFGDVIGREVVATEVVRALVGSIGLVASVPISTWLAGAVVSQSASQLTAQPEATAVPDDDRRPGPAR